MLSDIANEFFSRVVIVENDENDAVILDRILQRTGVSLESSWVESLDGLKILLKTDSVDLVICDYNLGVDSAVDVIRMLREWGYQIPVIVVSHHIGEKAAVEVMRAGACDVVNKVDYKHLVASVSKELLELDRQIEREKFESKLYDIDKERRSLQDALQKVQEAESHSKSLLAQLNKVFERSPDGMRVIDREFNVVRVNSNYLKYSDSESRESASGKCYDFTHREWCYTDDCPLRRVMKGEDRFEYHLKLKGKKGEERQFVLSISGLQDDQGEIDGLVENLRDVTEWHNMQRQMLHAQKMESIGQLAAGIAHEINTPTQFVGDNISFLKDGFNDLIGLLTVFNETMEKAKDEGCTPELIQKVEESRTEADVEFLMEEIPQALSQSADGVSRIASIVKAMKEFSHPGSEEAELFNVNQNIQNTVTVARNEWKYVSRVDMEFGFNLPMVRGYPGEFNQTILNMIVNAAHAIESKSENMPGWKGKIGLKTYSHLGYVVIEVSDNGGGIPDDVKGRIFDPFFTTKGVGKGTGQGLAIAHSSIVDKHNGKIEVDSTVGEGTMFTITLPSVELENSEVPK
ncbi:MAG: response regulator [Deltaproteobacteria bacterium]|nr:response regulator [Deltaproteobacteria bacterium]